MLQNFTAGVVFVIDSTKSMGPYIARTREAVEKLYEDISGKSVSSKVSFGLVAGWRWTVWAVAVLMLLASAVRASQVVKEERL